MSNSWAQTIAAGIVSQPHNIPKRLEVEYSNGAILTLQGVALQDFWVEMIQSRIAVDAILSNIEQQQQARSVQPTITSDKVRENIRARSKMGIVTDKDDE